MLAHGRGRLAPYPDPMAADWDPTPIEGVRRRSLDLSADSRGSFRELWRESWTGWLGVGSVAQANLSISNAGVLRGQLGRRGRPRAQADMLIAATAALHGLTLATRNVRDFEDCGVAVVNPFT